MKNILKTFLIFICLISIAFADKQIDTFNILLPQINSVNSGRPIQLITTQGGCFKWESSDPQIVGINPLAEVEDVNCNKRAIIQLKHVGSYLSSLYVTATHSQNQQLSNYIPVRIRPIHNIEIIAKSRMMNRNQMQDLHVFAYDKQHNMFTSLEGLRFQWQLVQNNEVISKISLKNSQLILPLDQRKNIQKKGAQSDILVIKGINPGKSIVRVRCIQSGYQNLRHQITISVHQRFDINPSQPTYVLTDSLFKFGLVTPSRETISIPKSYYKMILSSQNFKINNLLELRAPSTQDLTRLRVQDTRTDPPYYSEAQIFAKQPDEIVLKVDEYIVVGDNAKVEVQLYWKKHLLRGEHQKYHIMTELPYDKVKRSITASQRAIATVKAVYNKSLAAQKKVYVVTPIKVVLPSGKVTLPVEQTFQLKVIGGSGSYEYHVGSADVASISSSGIIFSRKEGHTTITIVDKKVSKNRVIIELVVTPLSSLVPLQTNKELNINEFGYVFTIGKGKNYQIFTKCSQQKISLEISHLSNFQLSENSTYKNSLQFLNEKMTRSGKVKESINKNAIFPFGIQDFVSKYSYYIKSGDVTSYEIKKYAQEIQNYGICSAHYLKSYQKYDNPMQIYSKSQPNVRNKFNLRVYQKIVNRLQNQTDDYFIMTPLAMLEWRTAGGSYQWDSTYKTRILLNSVESKLDSPFIQCPQKETVLQMKLQKQNPQTNNLLFPVSQSKIIYIQCKYPSSLKIQYQSENFETAIVNGIRGKVIQGKLIPLDDKGETFYNSSNLIYQHYASAGQLTMTRNTFQFDPKRAQSAKINFFTQSIEKLKTKFNKVQASFSYFAKQMFQLSPLPQKNHLITLYNPKTSYFFRLNRVSQNLDISCEGSIECIYHNSNKQIRMNTTKLGAGSMRIKDKAIYGYPSMLITFQVVDADYITVEASKTMLEIHKTLTAEIKLFYKGTLIPTWQYDKQNLMLVHEAGIRSKQLLSATQNSVSSAATYEIIAQKAGIYHLTAEQHYPRYLQSNSIVLTVYPKVSVNLPNLEENYSPQNILQLKGSLTVAMDCLRKVYIHGGPKQLKTTYQVTDKDALQIRYPNGNNLRQLQIFGRQKSTTKVTFKVYSPTQKDFLIATIQISITVKPINHAMISTLDQAAINAQFRILPYLILDDQILLDSICQLNYKWKIDSKLKLRVLDSKQQGINATALKEGESKIELEVSNKDKQVLFTASKEILIHKSLDIDFPTLIGQHQPPISTNLLLPPNSGYTFQDSNIQVTKLSQCQDSVLSISNNKLTTFRQKGIVNVKLQKNNDKNYNNYLNVIITDIKTLFIENNYNKVLVELGKQKQIRFYVQDMYGRLFYNNLHNVNYEVISSNQDVFVASIDQTKNFINIQPKKQGEANLILKIKSAGTSDKDKSSPLTKLREIPHDIVIVQVGKVIEPQSPIYLLVGGSVNIQYDGKNDNNWNVVSGKQCIEYDEKLKTIIAKKQGQSTLLIGGYSVIVRVLSPSVKQKVIEKLKPGFKTGLIEFVIGGIWNEQFIFTPSIQNVYGYINNNLNLACVASPRSFFDVTSTIEKTENFDKLICQFSKTNNGQAEQTQPPREIQIGIRNVNTKTLIHSQKFDISPTFWVDKKFKNVILSTQKPTAQIKIRSSEFLDVEIVGGSAEWVEHTLEDNINKIKLNLASSKLNENREFVIRVLSKKTDQREEIIVNYVANRQQAEQKQKQQKKQEEKEEKKEKKQEETSSQSWFSGFHWTDFLIVIMAIFFLAILAFQSCLNGNDKYKVL